MSYRVQLSCILQALHLHGKAALYTCSNARSALDVRISPFEPISAAESDISV